MSKIDRALHGPSWAEVIIGAFLSLILGAAIGAAILITRPVVVVRELPKPADQKRGAVYYIEGSKDSSKAAQAMAKRKAFIEGQSVTLSEDEINAVLAMSPAAAPAPAPKPVEKKGTTKAGSPAPAGAGETIVVGAPNVRIRDGLVQVGAPVTLTGLGVSEKVVVQARGTFVKDGAVFTYEPSEMFVGSCPVQRVPVLAGFIRDRMFAAQRMPDDIAAAWRKLSNVAVEGNVVRLSP